MSLPEALLVLLAGVLAGAINTLVGSGTLVTFPTLLAIGLPSVTANVTNTVGLFPGSFSGAWGYRAELAGQRRRVWRFLAAATAGGVVGAFLLLLLPASAFRAIVPGLILLGVVLVAFGKQVRALLARFRRPDAVERPDGGPLLLVGLFLTGVYGGYFGAAQGVIILALFGVALNDTLQRYNAVKNLLSASVNLVAAVVFVFVSSIDWRVAGVLAVGSVIGGQVGAKVGRRLPPVVLRAVIVVVGLVAAGVLLFR